jgi:hypothetical protein
VRIAFPIWRLNFYRLLTPVIDEALGRGITVECWHDYGVARDGHKGYQFPEIDAAPKFLNGTPVFRTYRGAPGLEMLARQVHVDALVGLQPPRSVLGPGRRAPVPWFLLQDSPGCFLRLTPDDLVAVEALGLYSDYWLEWGLGIMQAKGLLTPTDPRLQVIRAKSRVVGFPELDVCQTLDHSAIRARLGLASTRPVVTFIPYPYRSNPTTFWSRWIYGNPRPWLQAAMIVARGEHRYWSHVRHGWHDRNLVTAVRAFCDANGAALVVKYRDKDPIPSYLRDVADVAIADPEAWPPTVLETLAVSDLAVSFYSSTVLESAFLGVPYLCIGFGDADWLGELDPIWAGARFSGAEGGEFNYPGVNQFTDIPDVIAGLSERRLAEFRVDPGRRHAYVARFLGPDDGRSAARMVDLITGEGR